LGGTGTNETPEGFSRAEFAIDAALKQKQA
jgi:hypothetical protein